MLLTNTKALVDEMLAEKRFGTCAIRVWHRGDSASVFSPDANEDTLFDNASMGKVLVTSTLILHAVGEGRLALTDPLPKFFDNVPAGRENITVKMLLTHTSGIVRCPIPDRVADCGRDAVAEYIMENPLAYKPGTAYIYSCNGYILLGYILEKLYGMGLDKIYEEILVKPLGYTRSRFCIGFDTPNAAVCYRWKNPGLRPSDDENVYTLHGIAGSGASYSTLADMEKFIGAVLRRDERLYPRELFDLAERDYTPFYTQGRGLGYLMPDCRYAQTGDLFPKGSFGHCGHCGHSFFVNREEELYVIILTNATRYANMKNDFRGYDYGEIERMRLELHNAIKSDLY